MEEKKLICPVKRIDKPTNVDFKIDLQDDQMNIKLDVTTKNIIKTTLDYITKKLNKEKKNG